MEKNNKKMLLRFLKQNKCLEKFIYNLLTYPFYYVNIALRDPAIKDKSKMKKFVHYLGTRDLACNYITEAFDWSLSPEGDPYWRSLSIRWKDKFIKIK